MMDAAMRRTIYRRGVFSAGYISSSARHQGALNMWRAFEGFETGKDDHADFVFGFFPESSHFRNFAMLYCQDFVRPAVKTPFIDCVRAGRRMVKRSSTISTPSVVTVSHASADGRRG